MTKFWHLGNLPEREEKKYELKNSLSDSVIHRQGEHDALVHVSGKLFKTPTDRPMKEFKAEIAKYYLETELVVWDQEYDPPEKSILTFRDFEVNKWEHLKPEFYSMENLHRDEETIEKLFLEWVKINNVRNDVVSRSEFKRYRNSLNGIDSMPLFIVQILMAAHYNVFNLPKSEYIEKGTV